MDDLDSAAPLLAKDANRIDGYDLVFQFSDKKKGLSSFHFKVEVDKSGKIFEGTLPLPNIAVNTEKAVLIPCRQAMEAAKENGFPPERSSIIFVYDWDQDVFTYIVSDSKAVEPDTPTFMIGKGTYRKIKIEAHTGRVIKIYKETIII